MCVSQPNLLNYSTDWDEIWCVTVFLSVDLNPIKKIRVRSLFSPKIDFFENLKKSKIEKNYQSIKFKPIFSEGSNNSADIPQFRFSIFMLGKKFIEVYKSSLRFFATFFENLKLIITKKNIDRLSSNFVTRPESN